MAIPIDRLRAELMSQVPHPRRVTATFTQYFMDEDTAAFCDIDVQPGAICEFGIVVLRQHSAERDAFLVRTWRRFADEVWLVDEAQRAVHVTPHEGDASVIRADEILRTSLVPTLAIDVAQLFA